MWGYFPLLDLGVYVLPLARVKVYKPWVCAALEFYFSGWSQQLRDAPRTVCCPLGHLQKELLEISRTQADCLRDLCSACTCAPDLATDDVIVCLCCPSKRKKDVQCFVKLDKPKISLNWEWNRLTDLFSTLSFHLSLTALSCQYRVQLPISVGSPQPEEICLIR